MLSCIMFFSLLFSCVAMQSMDKQSDVDEIIEGAFILNVTRQENNTSENYMGILSNDKMVSASSENGIVSCYIALGRSHGSFFNQSKRTETVPIKSEYFSVLKRFFLKKQVMPIYELPHSGK